MIAPPKKRERIHPLTGKPYPNGRPRAELARFMEDANGTLAERRRRIQGRYDAAQDNPEFQNYWAAADSFDADSANSRAVREKLVPRSRYETANNGFADGIAQTYATDLVGVGPQLRMETASTGFNQMVELRWRQWAKAVHFRRKLWCLAHAKHTDGEGIAILQQNPGLRHPVTVDLRLYETEQIQSRYPRFDDPHYIDGIEFDDFGNPTWYDVLPYHPGGQWGYVGRLEEQRVRAEFVLHWFKLRRPGQHRGVPEMSSTLNCGAAGRRWREAYIASLETRADFTLFIKTLFQPDELDQVSPMSTLDIQKRMMTALPMGWDIEQPNMSQNNSGYQEFNRSLINEQARPKNMPFNKAACDSADYNYASGRLDHQTYYAALDVDRQDCIDVVLEPSWRQWMTEAIPVYNWLGGRAEAVSIDVMPHSWDFPKHRVADVEAEANANRTRLESGQTSPSQLCSDAGIDYEDFVLKMANDYGVDVDTMKGTLLKQIFQKAASVQVQQDMPRQEPTR